MDPLCEQKAALRKPSGPSSLKCTDPQRWSPVRGATPARRCPIVPGLRMPAGVTDVVSSRFESGQRRRLRWAVGAHRYGRRSSAGPAPGYDRLRDRRKVLGGPRLGPGRPGSPPVRPRIAPRRIESREQSKREGARRVILLERGPVQSQLRAAGTL